MSLAYPAVDLTDGTVCLRSWREDDLDCVRAAAHDPRIVEATTVPGVFSVDAGQAFIRRQWSRADSGEGVSLAIADAVTGQAIGSAVLMLRPQPGVAGLGYWLIPSARGRGIATRAARLASSWAIDVAGIARVEAWVEPENEASRRVLTAAGFEQEGVLRSFLAFAGRRADAVVFSKIRDTRPRQA
ncbi:MULTISPECIES: GNAT family N-acetyltransferase [unclassified Plantactinospora]|uniref:GNAT family N-acetyltransferase n=1 Tax=unclassified Plantactinospora TaxID=2631981 RepID=UPI000D1622CE|nr:MULTISPECIES: GNAT family N-acetyltransferase [unclassified Plantactinospora]AVT32587.1 N-acetyltransferase [Plantactinospora sp. BC1]AVT39615.1 N-acetyltransferase [Plantactinospora sp. BB1]